MAADRPPVLLVPGAFGQDFVYWNVMKYLLARDGYPVHTVTFPRFTLVDLEVSAESLARRVERVLDASGAERVHLLAHSMGGLISRHYLQEMEGSRRVRALACLGVPHHGTWAGLTAPVLKGCRQILPGSEFLRKLNDPTLAARSPTPIVNLWSRVDMVIVPSSNAALALPGVENHALLHAHHWGMLVSPWVYRHVKRGFEAAERSAAERAGEAAPIGVAPVRKPAPG